MSCSRKLWDAICVKLLTPQLGQKRGEPALHRKGSFECGSCGLCIETGEDVHFALGSSYCSQACRALGMSPPSMREKIFERLEKVV